MPQIRYFQTEKQRAQLADMLITGAKEQGQKAQDSREWTFDRLTDAAVQGNIGVNSVYEEGQITLNSGQTLKISKKELDDEEVKSDSKWKPDREGAKLNTIQVSESSILYGSLVKAAALENAITRKINGNPKYSCLEAYIDNVLNSHMRNNEMKMFLKDLQSEKKVVFTPKPEEKKEEKPAPNK